MTLISELSDRLELNPDAAYPPFPLYLDLPTTWTLLDTNPATWERSAERMVDETFHGSRVTGKERRQVIGFFGQLVEGCQEAGSALSILQVGRLREGVAASLGVHIAFVDEQTESTVGRIRDSLPRTGTVIELDSGVGPALQRSERTTFMPPGTGELVSMTSIQIFAPIEGTSWTVVLATASAYPELTEPVTTLLQNIAVSLRLTEDKDAEADPDPDAAAEDAPEQFERSTSVRGPGIERGFNTLIRKKVGPDTPGSTAEGSDPDAPARPAADEAPGDGPARWTDEPVSDPRPKIILQAHATRSAVALALLLHGHERSPREAKKPMTALIAGLVLAIVIVVGFYVASRLGSLPKK